MPIAATFRPGVAAGAARVNHLRLTCFQPVSCIRLRIHSQPLAGVAASVNMARTAAAGRALRLVGVVRLEVGGSAGEAAWVKAAASAGAGLREVGVSDWFGLV
jgi:hypothetical protein